MDTPNEKTQLPTVPVSPRRRWRRLFLIVVSVCIVALGSLTAYAFYDSNRIVPHTQIADIKVGGLTKAQATRKVKTKEQQFSASQLTLHYQSQSWQIAATNLTPQFSNTAAIEAAYAVGKSGPLQNELRDFLTSLFRERSFDVNLATLSSSAQQKLSTTVLNKIETPPQETTLSFSAAGAQIVPGIAGKELVMADFQSQLYQAFVSDSRQINLSLGTVQPKVSLSEAAITQTQANAILATDWTLQAGNQKLVITPQELAGWLIASPAPDPATKQIGLALSLNESLVDKALTTFATSVNVAPTNAIFAQTSTGLSVSLADKSGLALQITPTFQLLNSAIQTNNSDHTISAVTVAVPATIQASMSSSLQLIGSSTTNFSGSPASRVTNIDVGVKDINGQLVENGQTFSTVATLGPIDETHGYVPGLVIIGNETIPEDGGGLCQVSTTLFRAVLNAGLPVTERVNHSYEVSYYQRGIGPGLDATIYDPSPDFKWKNDTGNPVYVQAFITGTNLTFNLYGTSDGRTATINGPNTLQTYPVTGAPIYTNTNTLPVGKTEMIDGPVEGARTTATYTVTRDGKVINTQVFNSYYQPMPAQYLVGTGS